MMRALVLLLGAWCSAAQVDCTSTASQLPIEAPASEPLVASRVFKVVAATGGAGGSGGSTGGSSSKSDPLPWARLVIGVMSSPAHAEQRQALRESWFQFPSLLDPKLNTLTLEEKASIVIRFFVGNSPGRPELEKSLEEEASFYHDIVRIPIDESYFNLTLKSLEFFKWADGSYNYTWAMKCDDDSFVRPDLVLQDLLPLVNTPRVYMGKIWTGTPTDRRIDPHTPWKQYASFAAGAGYVLSSDLVAFIVRNEAQLFKYPLEDVAVGSWIAPLKATHIDNPHFHSLPEGCDRLMRVQNPANVTVMKHIFANSVLGVPCNVDPDPFHPSTKNVPDHVLLELGIPKPQDSVAGVQSMIDTGMDDRVMAVAAQRYPDEMSGEADEPAMGEGMAATMMNGNLPSPSTLVDMNRSMGAMREEATLGQMGNGQADEVVM